MSAWLRQPVSFGLWLATCAVIGLLLGGGVWLYGRLQVARVDAIERLCLRDNAHAHDNIEFIHSVNPRLDARARQVFRLTPDCRRFAKVAANQPPPQPGVTK